MAEIVEAIEEFGLSQKDRKKNLFSKIGVVGCGHDGRDIVQLTALAGMEVIFIEVSDRKIKDALDAIEYGLDTRIQNWGLTQGEKRATMGRIKGSKNYGDLRNCDFVIECIRYEENGEKSTEMRKDAFRAIEQVVAKDAIIATNATTVIISELAAELVNKERCVALHFQTTHPDARLLEVVAGTFTSEGVLKKINHFANMIKYIPIRVKESSGLVGLRLMVVMLNEACQMLMESVASMEDIDKEFTMVYGQRIGIFEQADRMGIEKVVMLMEDMFNEYGDRKYKATPILWRLYRSKQTGVAVGKGFYIYDSEGKIVGSNKI